LYGYYFTKEAVEGFGDFKTGQVICSAKYADDLLILAREETVLGGMIESLTEIGRMWKKNEGDENLKATIAHTDYPLRDQKRRENVEFLNCLGNMITNGARFARKFSPGLP